MHESPFGAQPEHWPKGAKTLSPASLWVPQRPSWAWVAGRSDESLSRCLGKGSASPGSWLQMGPNQDFLGALPALSQLGLDPRCWPLILPSRLLPLVWVCQAL